MLSMVYCITHLSHRRIVDVRWEGGENLLGKDAIIELDAQTGDDGCINGTAGGSLAMAACKRTWRFFNINGAGERRGECIAGGSSGSLTSTPLEDSCTNVPAGAVLCRGCEVLLLSHGIRSLCSVPPPPPSIWRGEFFLLHTPRGQHRVLETLAEIFNSCWPTLGNPRPRR